ncbi:MAG: protoporphyrinogen oxidase HemJ [Bacteroidota bacterium]
MMNAYFICKIFHIVGFVAWFAGLFYLVRMFVYHTEAFDKKEPKQGILRSQFNLMEWRVYKIICNPAMMITWTAGLTMIFLQSYDWFAANTWLHFKITLVFLLTIYHVYCKRIIKKLEHGKTGLSSTQFRLFNEVPTVFLILISSIAVYKNATNPYILVVTIIGIIILLIVFTKMYKKVRESKEKRQELQS